MSFQAGHGIEASEAEIPHWMVTSFEVTIKVVAQPQIPGKVGPHMKVVLDVEAPGAPAYIGRLQTPGKAAAVRRSSS